MDTLALVSHDHHRLQRQGVPPNLNMQYFHLPGQLLSLQDQGSDEFLELLHSLLSLLNAGAVRHDCRSRVGNRVILPGKSFASAQQH